MISTGFLWGTLCSVTASLSVCQLRLLNAVAFKNATADFISVNGFYQARNTAERKGSIFLLLHKLVYAEAGKMTVITVTLFSNPLSSVAIAEWPPYRGVCVLSCVWWVGESACVPTVICECLGRGAAALFNLLGTRWRDRGFTELSG